MLVSEYPFPFIDFVFVEKFVATKKLTERTLDVWIRHVKNLATRWRVKNAV
jgi:hypothetical protein